MTGLDNISVSEPEHDMDIFNRYVLLCQEMSTRREMIRSSYHQQLAYNMLQWKAHLAILQWSYHWRNLYENGNWNVWQARIMFDLWPISG